MFQSRILAMIKDCNVHDFIKIFLLFDIKQYLTTNTTHICTYNSWKLYLEDEN